MISLRYFTKTHPKTGEEIIVVSMADRLDRSEFLSVKSSVLEFGGYYSKFAKGFVFKTEDLFNQFLDAMSDTYDLAPQGTKTEPAPKSEIEFNPASIPGYDEAIERLKKYAA